MSTNSPVPSELHGHVSAVLKPTNHCFDPSSAEPLLKHHHGASQPQSTAGPTPRGSMSLQSRPSVPQEKRRSADLTDEEARRESVPGAQGGGHRRSHDHGSAEGASRRMSTSASHESPHFAQGHGLDNTESWEHHGSAGVHAAGRPTPPIKRLLSARDSEEEARAQRRRLGSLTEDSGADTVWVILVFCLLCFSTGEVVIFPHVVCWGIGIALPVDYLDL